MSVSPMTFTGINDLIEIAESGRFSHAVISYTITEKEPDVNGVSGLVMSFIHCAFFSGVPTYMDIVSLYAEYVSNMEKYGVDEETLETMFVRVETNTSLVEMLSSAYSTLPADRKNDESSDDGWSYGVAGNA